MVDSLRIQLAARLLGWGEFLRQLARGMEQDRQELRVLLFFHGYSLAHTIRPLVAARALRARGYPVEMAGRGPHVVRVRQDGFQVHDVETLPQTRMDQYVGRSDYGYYDLEWIDRCVNSERALMHVLRPALVIHDMKPTVSVSARLEGIDDARVTQAYNQPAYPTPIRLPEGFATEAGPFNQYLAQHASLAKHRRSFYLLADIPELHPPGVDAPGFHYVGPLLDTPPEPPRLAVLDEGWDASWPLVYLTCGSSGRPPEYLDDLIRAVRGRPYRVLVTTAGRWSGTTSADNVRVVDFLPGEWVLRRAKVLVGVVGIGSIYQALRCGVPVVGAPDHLDQEYHLNRLELLGLGEKLDRRDFAAPAILAAVERVLAHQSEYAQRMAPLAESLSAWRGGEAVADLVDAHFRARDAGYGVGDAYLVAEEDFVRYLDLTTPPSLSPALLRRFLRTGIRRGLPHRYLDGVLYYDRLDSWNWLYDHDQRFFAADYWALEERRERFLARVDGRVQCREPWQKYRLHYRFCLSPDGLPPDRRVRLYLPYPIVRPGHQEAVSLLSCEPDTLRACWVPSMGFFYGHPADLQTRGPLEVSYACELRVREHDGRANANRCELQARLRQRYLEVETGLAEQPEVVQALGDLRMQAGDGDEARARATYELLTRGRRFRKTKDHAQDQIYCTVAVLTDPVGHCVTLARAFVALCRLQGLPAREVCGALIGYPAGDGRFAMRSSRELLFGHTWAEVYLEEHGWWPVEFHGIAIGEMAATTDTVGDGRLNARLAANGPAFLDYYFGRVDHQRVLCSNAVKSIPEVLVECPDAPEGSRRRWEYPRELRYECELQVECL